MSVLIRGMEMPTSCFACPLVREDVCGATDYTISRHHWKDRADTCPLIPVPLHGGLIDKKDIVPKDGYIIADGMACIPVKDIANAPTIISADPPVMEYPQVPGITPTVIAEEGET